MTSPVDSLIEHGVDLLSTAIDSATGRIFAFLGDVKAKRADPGRAKIAQPLGFASRARKADAGKAAAQVIVVRRSDGDIVIGASDSRTQEMYGALDDGESAVFASDGQARALFKKDGSVNLYTRVGNTSDGAGMVIQLDAANNAVRILNGLGFGLIADASGVTITAGDAALTLGADGNVTLVGTKQTQVDGASIVLGSLAVPGVNSAIHGPTGLAGIASLKTLIE
jgi:hypothetical protein